MKALVRALALVSVLPRYVAFRMSAAVFGEGRALQGATQALARGAGIVGTYRRVAFLHLVLEQCDPSATVEYGVLFSQVGARLGRNVYIGPNCHLGWVHIGDDTLLAGGIHVPSGPDTHGIARLDVPIRSQPGHLRPVHIGRDCWIGSAAVILADVGDQAVVAAGAVVTAPVEPRVVVGGVPAKVLRRRSDGPGHAQA